MKVENQSSQDENASGLVGHYVIVRAVSLGVFAGVLVKHGFGYAVLNESRRLWYHDPGIGNDAWYEGVSISGLSDKSITSAQIDGINFIQDTYLLIPCSEAAESSIRSAKSHKCPGNA